MLVAPALESRNLRLSAAARRCVQQEVDLIAREIALMPRP